MKSDVNTFYVNGQQWFDIRVPVPESCNKNLNGGVIPKVFGRLFQLPPLTLLFSLVIYFSVSSHLPPSALRFWS